MAILLLIGHGSEQPSYFQKTYIQTPPYLDLIPPASPIHEVTDGLPLILWDWGYDETMFNDEWRKCQRMRTKLLLPRVCYGEYSRSLDHTVEPTFPGSCPSLS